MNFPWGRLLIIIQYQVLCRLLAFIVCTKISCCNTGLNRKMILKKPKSKFKNICTMNHYFHRTVNKKGSDLKSNKNLRDLIILFVVSSLGLSDGERRWEWSRAVTSWQMLSINRGAKLKHVITSKPGSGIAGAHTNPNVTFHYRIKGNKGHVLQKQISVFIILFWLRCNNIYGRVINSIKREN